MVKRSDPIYNAHAYLTKIPFAGITPFIEAFTEPGETVLDMFAGSGMTGVAAAVTGRRAELRDIAALGRHIGRGYLNLVESDELREEATAVVSRASAVVNSPYAVECAGCGSGGELSRTTWSVVYQCRYCEGQVPYYSTLATAGWAKGEMICPRCAEPFKTRGAARLTEEAVLDTIACGCSRTLRDQPPAVNEFIPPAELHPPRRDIGADRQMFKASALAKHGLHTTADFFTPRNLYSLEALRQEILRSEDPAIQQKLLVGFTGILTRASKRYQWSRKRPLNAANANYYIAPVFYEWNVFDLFSRKIDALVRADDQIRRVRSARGLESQPLEVNYKLGSADRIDLPSGSVDYIFCDPPFGSNIFYSDMNLFQEAWLESITDHAREAVVDRSRSARQRTAERYERLLADSLREAHRVLKDDGLVSMNFSNSSGGVWALVQRAIAAAGFVIEPGAICLLEKGQRSVKGLASGFESIVTADLVLTMRKSRAEDSVTVEQAPAGATDAAIDEALLAGEQPTPTRIYLGVVRAFLRRGWDVSGLDIAALAPRLTERGFVVDAATGHLTPGLIADAA